MRATTWRVFATVDGKIGSRGDRLPPARFRIHGTNFAATVTPGRSDPHRVFDKGKHVMFRTDNQLPDDVNIVPFE